MAKTTDSMAYTAFCICTLGLAAVLRVIISVAIRKAKEQ